jgi:hypothetical protein
MLESDRFSAQGTALSCTPERTSPPRHSAPGKCPNPPLFSASNTPVSWRSRTRQLQKRFQRTYDDFRHPPRQATVAVAQSGWWVYPDGRWRGRNILFEATYVTRHFFYMAESERCSLRILADHKSTPGSECPAVRSALAGAHHRLPPARSVHPPALCSRAARRIAAQPPTARDSGPLV